MGRTGRRSLFSRAGCEGTICEAGGDSTAGIYTWPPGGQGRKKAFQEREHLCQMLAGKDDDQELTIESDNGGAVSLKC